MGKFESETAGRAPQAVTRARFDAVLFDLDGVLTSTAEIHAEAWKEMFDAYLRKVEGGNFRPFDIEHDYKTYVDGKPRYEGVRSFLSARGIELPLGSPAEPPSDDSISGLGSRKDALVK